MFYHRKSLFLTIGLVILLLLAACSSGGKKSKKVENNAPVINSLSVVDDAGSAIDSNIHQRADSFSALTIEVKAADVESQDSLEPTFRAFQFRLFRIFGGLFLN